MPVPPLFLAGLEPSPLPLISVSTGESPRVSHIFLAPSSFTSALHVSALTAAIDGSSFHGASRGFCLVQPVSRKGPCSWLCLVSFRLCPDLGLVPLEQEEGDVGREEDKGELGEEAAGQTKGQGQGASPALTVPTPETQYK